MYPSSQSSNWSLRDEKWELWGLTIVLNNCADISTSAVSSKVESSLPDSPREILEVLFILSMERENASEILGVDKSLMVGVTEMGVKSKLESNSFVSHKVIEEEQSFFVLRHVTNSFFCFRVENPQH